jgi:hypothetical protein
MEDMKIKKYAFSTLALEFENPKSKKSKNQLPLLCRGVGEYWIFSSYSRGFDNGFVAMGIGVKILFFLWKNN